LSKNRTFLLILVCLALGVLVFLDNRRGGGAIVEPSARARGHANAAAQDGATSPEVAAEAPVSPEMRLTNPLADFDTSLLKDWIERPLFAPSRQRPAAVAAATPRAAPQVTPKQPPPSYDLLGILRDGERAIALLRKKGEGTSFRVEVGDMIGGWRVARMEPASVVLERADGTSQTVPLSRE
jgi:hypothetical protein